MLEPHRTKQAKLLAVADPPRAMATAVLLYRSLPKGNKSYFCADYRFSYCGMHAGILIFPHIFRFHRLKQRTKRWGMLAYIARTDNFLPGFQLSAPTTMSKLYQSLHTFRVMKNWLLFVLAPLLAMLSKPSLWCRMNGSSSNLSCRRGHTHTHTEKTCTNTRQSNKKQHSRGQRWWRHKINTGQNLGLKSLVFHWSKRK